MFVIFISFAMKYLLFLIVPACVYLAVIPLREAWGHYYYAINSDPSYLYLFNGLNIAQLQPSVHVDNPGSTVQILSAAVIRATAFFRNADDIQKDVILHPESYIRAINYSLFAICLSVLFLFGVFAYRFTGSLPWSLFLQSAPFVSWQTMRIFLKVSPEMLIFISCILWAATLLRLSAKNDFREHHLMYTFWFAFLTGISLATKLTMIPFMIIPLMLFPLRISVNYLLLSFIFFLLLIFPAWEHFEYLLNWVSLLYQHSSLYGGGEPNIIRFPEAFFSLGRLLVLEHTFYFIVFAASGLLVIASAKKSFKNTLQFSIDAKILRSLLLVVLIQLLMIAKHFNPHYLIPSLMLFTAIIYFTAKVYSKVESVPDLLMRTIRLPFKTGLIIFLILMLFFRHLLKNLTGYSVTAWLSDTLISNGIWMIIAVMIVLTAAVLVNKFDSQKKILNRISNTGIIIIALLYCLRHADLAGFHSRLLVEAEDSENVMNMVNERYSDYTVILGERSSSLFYALKYGANENFPQPRYFEKMKALYKKDAYFWDHSVKFKTWTDETTLADILRQNQKVILECDHRFTLRNKLEKLEQTENVSLEKVYTGISAELYIIKPRS